MAQSPTRFSARSRHWPCWSFPGRAAARAARQPPATSRTAAKRSSQIRRRSAPAVTCWPRPASDGTTGPNLDVLLRGRPQLEGSSRADDPERRLDQYRQPSRAADAEEPRHRAGRPGCRSVRRKSAKGTACRAHARPRRPPGEQKKKKPGCRRGRANARRQVDLPSAGCAGCHTLKAAGATGNVGPNLDALKPPEPTVKHQVERRRRHAALQGSAVARADQRRRAVRRSHRRQIAKSG